MTNKKYNGHQASDKSNARRKSAVSQFIFALSAALSLGGCAPSHDVADTSKDHQAKTLSQRHDSSPVLLEMADANNVLGSIEIYDDKALELLSAQSKVSVRGQGYQWVEGPVWVDDGQYLLFSDIPNNEVRKFSPTQGESLYLKNSGFTVFNPKYAGAGSNGLLLNNKGQLVLLQHGDRQVAVMNAPLNKPQASYQTLVNNYQGKKFNSPNDGVFDRQGNLFFTDPAYGIGPPLPRKAELAFKGVFRLTPSGSLTLLDKEVTFPNGIGLSVDNKKLYVAVSDPQNPLWLSYDVQADGSVANKQVFYRVNKQLLLDNEYGLPDGMAVHSSGNIFATGPGGVWIFSPQGQVLAKIKTGLPTSNCTLTTNEEYLFVTADDYLLSVPLKQSR